jgi:hypothetical protein
VRRQEVADAAAAVAQHQALGRPTGNVVPGAGGQPTGNVTDRGPQPAAPAAPQQQQDQDEPRRHRLRARDLLRDFE